MQSTNPTPHSWKDASYQIAIAIGVAIVNAGFGLLATAFTLLVGRFPAQADANHTRAETDHLRAETQHQRLDLADMAIERFWAFYRQIDEVTDQLDKTKYELDNVKLIAAKVPELESRIEAQREANRQLTLMNERMAARLKLAGIEFPGPDESGCKPR
jgi:hypothetical protein